jgi:hypothetical protein
MIDDKLARQPAAGKAQTSSNECSSQHSSTKHATFEFTIKRNSSNNACRARHMCYVRTHTALVLELTADVFEPANGECYRDLTSDLRWPPLLIHRDLLVSAFWRALATGWDDCLSSTLNKGNMSDHGYDEDFEEYSDEGFEVRKAATADESQDSTASAACCPMIPAFCCPTERQ